MQGKQPGHREEHGRRNYKVKVTILLSRQLPTREIQEGFVSWIT